MAGVVGIELRNVVAIYPFERSRRFPESSRILATETIPRLSCGIEGDAAQAASRRIVRRVTARWMIKRGEPSIFR